MAHPALLMIDAAVRTIRWVPREWIDLGRIFRVAPPVGARIQYVVNVSRHP